jgi:hypothetical protein
MVEPEGPQMTSQHGACWICKATSAHVHPHAQAPTSTHAHRQIRPRMYYLFLSEGNNNSRTRIIVTYIACLLLQIKQASRSHCVQRLLPRKASSFVQRSRVSGAMTPLPLYFSGVHWGIVISTSKLSLSYLNK